MTNCNQDPRSLIVAHLPRVDQLTQDPDARQRGYVVLCRKARRWLANPTAEFWTYVHPAVRKAIRGRKGDQPIAEEPATVPELERQGDTGEVDVADLIDHLPVWLRETAGLWLAGNSQEVIGERLGISQRGAGKRIEKIRNLLRRAVA